MPLISFLSLTVMRGLCGPLSVTVIGRGFKSILYECHVAEMRLPGGAQDRPREIFHTLIRYLFYEVESIIKLSNAAIGNQTLPIASCMRLRRNLREQADGAPLARQGIMRSE